MRQKIDVIGMAWSDKISFEEVYFAHRNRNVLLDKVTMSFEKGKVTAIVGPSGSGKSTLAAKIASELSDKVNEKNINFNLTFYFCF